MSKRWMQLNRFKIYLLSLFANLVEFFETMFSNPFDSVFCSKQSWSTSFNMHHHVLVPWFSRSVFLGSTEIAHKHQPTVYQNTTIWIQVEFLAVRNQSSQSDYNPTLYRNKSALGWMCHCGSSQGPRDAAQCAFILTAFEWTKRRRRQRRFSRWNSWPVGFSHSQFHRLRGGAALALELMLLRSFLFRKLTGYLLFIFILLFTTHLFRKLNEMICCPWSVGTSSVRLEEESQLNRKVRSIEKGTEGEAEPWFWNSIEITHKARNAAACSHSARRERVVNLNWENIFI